MGIGLEALYPGDLRVQGQDLAEVLRDTQEQHGDDEAVEDRRVEERLDELVQKEHYDAADDGDEQQHADEVAIGPRHRRAAQRRKTVRSTLSVGPPSVCVPRA